MDIKVKDKETIKFLQEGGAMEDPNAAPATPPADGGGDPMQQIVMAFQQGLQEQNCELLAQAAQAFLDLIGGQAAPEATTAPVYKKGGILARRIPKN